MTGETKAEAHTWAYLRAYYYPRFVEGITKLSWDIRFQVLSEIHGSWSPIPPDPVGAMMEYVAEHSYFKFFVHGVEVQPDGYFRLHRLISVNLGRVGIFDD